MSDIQLQISGKQIDTIPIINLLENREFRDRLERPDQKASPARMA